MHSPSCHGTFVVIRGCVLGVLPAVCTASVLPSRGHQPHHTSVRKSLRDFTVSVPFSPRDIGGMS